MIKRTGRERQISTAVFATAALMSASLGNAPRAQAAGLFVKLPCSDAPSGFLHACKTTASQIADTLTKAVDIKLSCFYQQEDTDLTQGKGTAPDCTQNAKPFETPCNLALGEISAPNPDSHANFTSCGKPAVLSGGKLLAAGSVGTLEQSYFHGAYLQSLRSCRAAVLNEIKSKNGFDGGSCGSSIASDYNAELKTMGSAAGQLGDIQGFSESSSIDAYCDGSGPAPTLSPDQSKHMMAVCHLAAARSAVEVMYERMAQCEIFARWTRVWPASYAKLSQGLQDNASSYCSKWAKDNAPEHSYGVCPICYKSQSPDEITAAFNTCYQKTLPTAFKALVLDLFPEDGSKCGAGGTGS